MEEYVKKHLFLLVTILLGLVLGSCSQNATQFTLSTNSPLEISIGTSKSIEIQINRLDGFTDAVNLEFLSPSTQITGEFDPNPATGNSSTLTITLDNDLKAGNYLLIARGEANGRKSGVKFNISVVTTGTVSGYVFNKKGGEPVSGSTVTVEGSNLAVKSTTTDEKGYYQIKAAVGNINLVFTKDGSATARVEGLAVAKNQSTHYNTLQLPAFGSYLPITPPIVSLDLENTASELKFKLAAELSEKDINGFIFADVSLGSQGGSSGYLNASANHAHLGLDKDGKAEGALATNGFTGKVAVYAVVYDLNNNRSEVIKYIDLDNPVGETPAAPTKFSAKAVTFGDVGVFGTLGIPSGLDADTINDIFHASNVSELKSIIENISNRQAGISTLSVDLDGAVRWVDLNFSYPKDAVAPDAFIIYRKIGDEAQFIEIARISAEHALQEDGSFKYRDSNGIIEGLIHSYKVAAANGSKTTASSVSAVTPLAAFYVEATSPSNNSVDVSVKPAYKMSFKNSSDVNATMVIVLDRIQSNFAVPYQSPLFIVPGEDGIFSPFKGLEGIPHGVLKNDDGYFLGAPLLAPFHAYDWQTVAMTIDVDAEFNILAISVAADFFNVLKNFGTDFPSKDGPVNAFLTGDGSF